MPSFPCQPWADSPCIACDKVCVMGTQRTALMHPESPRFCKVSETPRAQYTPEICPKSPSFCLSVLPLGGLVSALRIFRIHLQHDNGSYKHINTKISIFIYMNSTRPYEKRFLTLKILKNLRLDGKGLRKNRGGRASMYLTS